MIYNVFHDLVNYLHAHPHVGGLIAFVVSFSESLAIIGSIIPGSVTMTAIGALIGSSVLPAGSTITWAILGAFCGDFLSYWFGFYFNERLRKMWPFRKHPQWIASGEAFFEKHGGKSIILGRFIGPMRSAVPMIAGLLKFNWPRFVLAAMPSAVGWAIMYMTPGILIGALSMELPAGLATKFIIYALIAIIICWAIFWAIQFFFKKICNFIDRQIEKLWRFLVKHRSLKWITHRLNDPRYPENHQQLTLLIFAIICGLFSLFVLYMSLTNGFLTKLDEPLHTLLTSLRNKPLDTIMLCFTLLGYFKTQLMAAGLIACWLVYRRYWRAAIHWIILVIGTSGIVAVTKKIFFHARPGGLLHGPVNSSFPSGHTTLSLALFGFLAVLIAREVSTNRKWIPYCIAIVLISFIAFSRLYLGAHWPTDILGSTFIGLTCIMLITISYRRCPTTHIKPKSLSFVAVVIYLIVWISYGWPHFQQFRYDYTPIWPTATLSKQDWWQQYSDVIPLYRINRLGHATQALNIQWLGSLTKIETSLSKDGWKTHPPHFNFKGTMNRLSSKQSKEHLPILPKLYHNKSPVLLMTKPADANQPPLVLRLWRSNITINNGESKLWLGTVNVYQPPHKFLTLHHKNREQHRYFIGAAKQLMTDLNDYTWQEIQIPGDEQPKALSKLHWDGVLLLIQPQTS